ncbi:hypothetical protein J5X84_36770 [Streptosporangiaceae bacterium NEAU-GS5]|nr:hypothetical protein [Streptosporangiaceae bacterium NEAU-GS5]
MQAEFSGGRAGQAPLTWGQRAIWTAIGRNPPGHFNIDLLLRVPRRDGIPLAEAVRAVGALVERHESLRTRIRHAEGRLYQDVASAGQVPVEVAEADAGAAADVARSLLDGWAGADLDDGERWPIRVGLVVADGAVRWIALLLSHVAADGRGSEIVLRDLRLLLRNGAIPAAPGLQPLDLARYQHSAGERRTRAAVAFWSSQYERLPSVMFTPDGPGDDPPHRRAQLTSPFFGAAIQAVASRHKVSSAAVLLAATGTMVARSTGHPTVALTTIVGNRFDAQLRPMVTSLDQSGLFTIDLDDGPRFAELVPRAWRSALRAYRHAYYDSVRLESALAELSRDRWSGRELMPYCCVNDVRRMAGEDALEAAAAELPADPERAPVVWLDDPPPQRCHFCLQVSDGPGGLTLRLTADTRCLPSPAMEDFLRGMEDLVLEAALT